MSERESVIFQRFDPDHMEQWLSQAPETVMGLFSRELRREGLMIQDWLHELLQNETLCQTTITGIDGHPVAAGEILDYVLASARIIDRLNQVTEAYLQKRTR